jgi:hypothetical protein
MVNVPTRAVSRRSNPFVLVHLKPSAAKIPRIILATFLFSLPSENELTFADV